MNSMSLSPTTLF